MKIWVRRSWNWKLLSYLTVHTSLSLNTCFLSQSLHYSTHKINFEFAVQSPVFLLSHLCLFHHRVYLKRKFSVFLSHIQISLTKRKELDWHRMPLIPGNRGRESQNTLHYSFHPEANPSHGQVSSQHEEVNWKSGQGKKKVPV